ncbi:MAG: DUF4199 domain-containing protein [Bacteroidota bacterium]|jgi:hypothetical protein
MRKIVLINGTISGLLMVLSFIVSFYMMEHGIITFDNSELFGYSSMIVVLSLIFFGIKSYRDKHQNGVITFGGGFKVGILIASIAALFYAGGWEIYYNTVPGIKESFMDRYMELSIKKMNHDGKSQEQINAKKEEMKQLAEMYKNPFIRISMTLMEIFPIGLAISLISAGILRKKPISP